MSDPTPSPNSSPIVTPSRREFLKTSSVIAAGGALASTLGIARSAHAAGDDTIKIALVGCGGRGTGACEQALSTTGPVKLVAMADAFRDNLDVSYRGLSKKHSDRMDVPEDRKFVGFDAYQKAIDSGIDLVILATSPGFRPIHFEAAVNAGKHVFMEKPVSTDAAGIRRVLASAEEAKKKNLKVGVGLQRRHQANYLETVKRLQDGEIGDITAMRVYWNGQTPWTRPRKPGMTEMEYQMRNWYYFVWTCGDHIVEQHIHNLDVAHWVKDVLPIRGNGMGGKQIRNVADHGQTFDHHCVELEYADGSRVFSQCRHTPGCWNPVAEYAHGTKGTCDISGSSIDVKGGSTWAYGKRDYKNPYQVEHDDLFAAIRSDTPYNEAKRGAESTMMAIFGRMLTYSGQNLTWDEAINSKISVMPKEFSFDATPPVVPDDKGNYPIPVPGQTRVV
ncbi:MAG TPA: Gfo/Idh/MocA family oxidoreductase [Pirellulales bacterium]|jgi:myo-inositol 2-dehydrogenase/D-chiro-inositol 1-dehydrogenase|nr:Gfo/Idh/MocA family oxidoreductase [Pirellulales bacterium]